MFLGSELLLISLNSTAKQMGSNRDEEELNLPSILNFSSEILGNFLLSFFLPPHFVQMDGAGREIRRGEERQPS